MLYRIEISSVAEAEADKAFLWISQRVSSAQAKTWYEGFLLSIRSLQKMPNRCPLARENDALSLEIRQLLYGKGRNCYRIVFTVLESEKIVRILHCLHSSQPAFENPEE